MTCNGNFLVVLEDLSGIISYEITTKEDQFS